MHEKVELKDAAGQELWDELRRRLEAKDIGDPQHELFFALPSWCREGIMLDPSDLDLEDK